MSRTSMLSENGFNAGRVVSPSKSSIAVPILASPRGTGSAYIVVGCAVAALVLYTTSSARAPPTQTSGEQQHFGGAAAATTLATDSSGHPDTGPSCSSAPPLPPSIGALCNVAATGVWPHMVRFFAQSSPPPITLYVANLDGPGGMASTVCSRTFNKKDHHAYKSKFAAEITVPRTARASRYAVNSPGQADLLLVSKCIMGKGRQGEAVKEIPEQLAANKTLAGWLKRPRDVVAIVTSDHGPCSNFREARNDQHKFPPGWHSDKLKEITLATNEGSPFTFYFCTVVLATRIRHICLLRPIH